MFGAGVLPPLVKSLEDAYGLSHTQMGTSLGVAGAVAAVGGMVGGLLYDRFGARAIMTLAMALCAAAALCLYSAGTAAVFVVSLMFFMGANGLGQVVNPLISRLYGRQRRRGMNLLHSFQGMGRLSAPLVVLVCMAVAGWRSAFILSAVAFVIWALLFFLGVKDGPGRAPTPPAGGGRFHWARKCLRDRRVLLGLVGMALGAGCESVTIMWLPNFLQREAAWPEWVPNFLQREAPWSRDTALYTLTAVMVGYTAVRVFAGLRGRMVNFKFAVLSAAEIVLAFVLIVTATSRVVLFPAGVLLGFGFGWYWPSLAGAIYDCVPEGQGAVGGLFQVTCTSMAFIFLAAAGALGDAFSLLHAILLAPCCGVLSVLTYGLLHVLVERDPAVRQQA